MAFFDGQGLGIVEEWSTSLAPNERQINAYPGVNGLEILDLGQRGATTTLRGVMSADSLAGLASVKAAFYGYQADGGGYVFIDDEGTSWSPVIMVMFRPVGPRKLLAGDAGVCQRYELELLHTGD